MHPGPVLVYFTAAWCQPCQTIAPLVQELEKKNPQIAFFKVDADAQPGIATQFSVRSLPTFISLVDGRRVDCFTGSSAAALGAMVMNLGGVCK